MVSKILPRYGSIDVTAYNESPSGKFSPTVKVLTICDLNVRGGPAIGESSE